MFTQVANKVLKETLINNYSYGEGIFEFFHAIIAVIFPHRMKDILFIKIVNQILDNDKSLWLSIRKNNPMGEYQTVL